MISVDSGSEGDSLGEGLGPAPLLELGEQLSRRRVMAKLLGVAPEPVRIGRYALEQELGHGGMGTVFRARDEQLGRAVALKFLRADRDDGGEAGEQGQMRLLEEAQALAAISHPNVVPIFDVGRHRGRVWLAMELVEGRTLRAWVRDARPSRSEILAAWRDAARGLAAVHAAGLVHRDIKPDNIQLGDDGRVRLLDFGLVRSCPSQPAKSTPSSAAPTTIESGPNARAVQTETGAFMGTRAYAAPEQLLGGQVDPRADQYAFCVSLYEALLDVRPRAAPLAPNQRLELADGQRLPRHVVAVLTRGLAADVEARFPDMNALLAVLERKRARWLIPAAIGVALLGGGGAGVWTGASMSTSSAPEPCIGAALAIDVVYTQRRTALLDAQPVVSRDTIAAALDDWSGRWRTAATTACAEVHVEQARSPASLDRRRACLDAQLSEFAVVVDALADDPTRTAALADWLGGLDDPDTCLSEAVLERRYMPSAPAQAERADALRRRLFALRVGADPRPLGDRLLAAEALFGEVESLVDDPSLRGLALDVLTELSLQAGDLERARGFAGALFDHASDNTDALLAAEAWRQLATIELELGLDPPRASWLTQRHTHAVHSLGDPPIALGQTMILQGYVAFVTGALAEAELAFGSAVTAFERAGPSVDVRRSRALRNLALIVAARGRADEATGLLEQASTLERMAPLDQRQRTQCISQRETAMTLHEAGKPTRAAAEAALATCTHEQGRHAEDVGDLHGLLAAIAIEAGELDVAREHAQAADAIYRALLSKDHSAHVSALSALGTIAFWDGRMDEAVALFRRSLQLAERSSMVDANERELVRANLGEALLALGRASEAAPLLERAVSSLDPELGGDHPATAVPRKALAAALFELGQPDAAQPHAERALTLLERDAGNLVELADTHWLLARIAFARGVAELGLRHAVQARATFEQLGQDFAPRTREIDDWLASRER